MNYLTLFLAILVGYLLGSIPNALIIGKVFFHKDIRQYGSHNLGGTNAGRVLGPVPGVCTIILDITKMASSIIVTYFICKAFDINDKTLYLGATSVMCAIGHCYPLYCGFKGGKAVSVIVGFLAITNPVLALVFGVFFFGTLYLKRMVSLASIVAAICTSLIMFIPFWSFTMMPFISYNIYYPITFSLLSILIVVRHIPNIKRIMNHTESKIKWMGKIK